MNFPLIKSLAGVLGTLGLYSVLYKENKFYRFWEHVFLGLASGWALVALWTETLKSTWWDNMVGTAAEGAAKGTNGYWAYALLLPIGLLGYAVFSKKHNWLSRIPIGILLGLYSGQQFQAWQNRYLPLVSGSMKPIIPNTSTFFKPSTIGMPKDQAAQVASTVYVSTAITNFVFVFTLLSVVSYFLFSFEAKNKLVVRFSLAGRWLLMIGFGAIFGSTIMMRFTLLIDRMYFIWIEFLQGHLLHR